MVTSVSMANVTTQPTSPEISIDRVRMTFARPDECAHLGGASPIAAQQLDAIEAASKGAGGTARIRRRSASLRVHRLADPRLGRAG